MAKDALFTAMDFYFEDNRPVPLPSKARKGEVMMIALPASVFAKVLLLKEKASKFSKGSMELVSAQEIADFIGYSYEHTKRSIISDPQFPNPVEFNGRTGGKTCNRWIAGEVVDFVVLKRKKKKADRILC